MLMFKRFIDLSLSFFGLFFLLPIFLIIAVAIKLTSKGPVFFVQTRLGKDCIKFKMYKFRTMVDGAENIGTGLFSFHDDYRITRVGSFLRHTSLDELPQIFNVILGDMSLVGPRPPVSYELGPIENFDKDTVLRFRVKPGITGLAQISGRNDLTWPEKIYFDNKYIDDLFLKGIIVDIRIIVKTFLVVVKMKNIVEKNS